MANLKELTEERGKTVTIRLLWHQQNKDPTEQTHWDFDFHIYHSSGVKDSQTLPRWNTCNLHPSEERIRYKLHFFQVVQSQKSVMNTIQKQPSSPKTMTTEVENKIKTLSCLSPSQWKTADMDGLEQSDDF